jgi:hypothetical protein
MNGFVRLWRKSMDSQVWQDAALWKVWCWCIMKAAYKETHERVKIGTGSTIVKLKPGQFVFQRHAAATQLKMHPSTVRDIMARLSENPTPRRHPELQNIDIQPDTHYSIVTVINWHHYQSAFFKPDTQPDTQKFKNPTHLKNKNPEKNIKERFRSSVGEIVTKSPQDAPRVPGSVSQESAQRNENLKRAEAIVFELCPYADSRKRAKDTQVLAHVIREIPKAIVNQAISNVKDTYTATKPASNRMAYLISEIKRLLDVARGG